MFIDTNFPLVADRQASLLRSAADASLARVARSARRAQRRATRGDQPGAEARA
ncbi:MAG: hypothetical protein ACSLFP_00070 [Acidimicrobiales bacterium]